MMIAVTIGLAAHSLANPLDPAGSLPAPEARATAPATAAEPDQATKARIVEAYGKLPLSFEANQGQTDGRVKYLARGPGYTLFLTPTEVVLVLRSQSSRTALRMRLVGAIPHPTIVAVDQLPGKSNYFIGNDPTKWRTNVPNYARVKYKEVYPGVDVIYYGNQRQLEYDLVVAPGADPKAITLAFDGAEKIEIDEQGDLILHIAGGTVMQRTPVMYQEINGVKQPINGHYVLRGKDRVAFQVGAYDVSRPLVIDPVVLTYSSYLGGGADDKGFGIAVDFASNAYVTGRTVSTGATPFFTTAGAFQTALGGAGFFDAFVTKVNAAGTMRLYSTYLGGSFQDIGRGIAVDGAGNVYVTGSTQSGDFPTSAGAFQTVLANAPNNGDADAFVTKLNPAGGGAADLVYSTFLGGANADIGRAIALDAVNNAYVTGETASTNFPTSAGAFQTVLANAAGQFDAFVTKLNPDPAGPTPDPSDLLYSTFLGGANADFGRAIALDAARNAYVTGNTASANFPTSAGAFQTVLANAAAQFDAFVARLNPDPAGPTPDPSDLLYSTFLGGANADFGNGIGVDSAALPNAYVTGSTASANFPTSAGAFQTALANAAAVTDAFITKLNPAGAGMADLVYSTFLGGGAADIGNDIAVDGTGFVYVTGSTASSAAIPPAFPTADSPFQPALGGAVDAFVARLDPDPAGPTPDPSDLLYSTYLGGLFSDIGHSIALDPMDDAYVAGETSTSQTDVPPFPIASFQATFGGVTDAFVSKVTQTAAPPPPPPPGGGGGGSTSNCFIATAAFGSPLASQVQLLQEFRDRYLLPHPAGQAFVTLYYTVSPPLAELIAGSEVLRAIVRVGLVPILGWAALMLWSPPLGLAISLVVLGLMAWLALWVARGRQWARACHAIPQSEKSAQLRGAARWRRLGLWSFVLFFVFAAAAHLEAGQEKRSQAQGRVKLVGDVRLPQATRFALIRDPKSAQIGLYKDGEAIFEGESPLPLAKIAAVHDHALVIALPSGRTVKIPKGERLPGARRLVFLRTALVDTFRYQVRLGDTPASSSNYSVVDILGRRAILERNGISREGQTPVGRQALPTPPRAPQETTTLATMVNGIPFDEVAPDTWEVPEKNVKELGNQLWPLLAETFRSATPVVTMGNGVGLRLSNSLGSGTLDRRGFEIHYAKLARRTGLEVGDRILSINDQPVNSIGGLVRIYRSLKSDASLSGVNVVIQRGDQVQTLTYRIR